VEPIADQTEPLAGRADRDFEHGRPFLEFYGRRRPGQNRSPDRLCVQATSKTSSSSATNSWTMTASAVRAEVRDTVVLLMQTLENGAAGFGVCLWDLLSGNP